MERNSHLAALPTMWLHVEVRPLATPVGVMENDDPARDDMGLGENEILGATGGGVAPVNVQKVERVQVLPKKLQRPRRVEVVWVPHKQLPHLSLIEKIPRTVLPVDSQAEVVLESLFPDEIQQPPQSLPTTDANFRNRQAIRFTEIVQEGLTDGGGVALLQAPEPNIFKGVHRFLNWREAGLEPAWA